MTVCQPPRQKIFMRKFTQLCDVFTKLRPVTLTRSVIFLIFMEFFMMKKTAIALGIAAMACGAQAADWMITPDHKFEVNADVGAYYQTKTSTVAGVNTTSILGKGLNQIQMKSTKTLANGWKMIGQIEVDFDPVQDNAPALSDDMRVGVDIPVWGRITAGQHDSFYEDNIAEALGFWGNGDIGFVTSEPASTSDGKRMTYYNKYENFEVVLDTVWGYATSSKTSQSLGLTTVVGYKLGDLQLYAGGGSTPTYFTENAVAAQPSFTTVNGDTVYYSNFGGVSASYTMGATKLAAAMQQVTAFSGAIYAYSGVGVEQTIDAWKVGFSLQQVNEGAANQFTQYAVGVNYTLAPKAIVFLEGNSLGGTSGYGNTVEFGMKYTF